jgi:hypothetical protein
VHRHHRIESTLRLIAARRERVGVTSSGRSGSMSGWPNICSTRANPISVIETFLSFSFTS